MATLLQKETLDVIQRKREEAREQHIKVAEHLSVGHKNYKTTLNTMISVGALTIVSTCISCAVASFGLATMLSQGVPMSPLDWVLAISELAVYMVSIDLGIRLYRINVTPIFALYSLIALLVLNAIFFMGILPLITVVFSIIGLVNWHNYKKWFITIELAISKKQKTKEKNNTSTTKKQKEIVAATEKENTREYDHISTTPYIVAIIFLSILIIGSSVGFYFLGRSHGYDDGKIKWYDIGYDDGTTDGYKSGFSGGEAAGESYGYSQGYNEGFNKMKNRCICFLDGGGEYCNQL